MKTMQHDSDAESRCLQDGSPIDQISREWKKNGWE